MWSLGILAGLLLTTNFPFAHPYTGRTSLQRIAELNLYNDGTEPSWVQLDGRAKDFVQRLLVLDPEERMTAEEGLEHAWFSNPAHRQEFEDVYGKAVAGWRPRGQNKAVFKDFSTVDFGWFLEQLKG
jgi:protein-serine/threonine kinase